MATEPSPLLQTLSHTSFSTITSKPTTPEPNITKRRLIVLTYWIVGLLGVPYWWNSTTIERLELPTTAIQNWLVKAPCYLNPSVNLAVGADALGGNELAQAVVGHLQRKLVKGCVDLRVGTGAPMSDAAYNLQMGETTSLSSGRSAIAASYTGLSQSLDSAQSVASTLLDLTSGELDPRVVKFASTYKLVFSLLNQDSASGDAVLDWDIQTLLKSHIQPLLTSLAPLHNFTIETQIQYFAPLTINVETTESGSTIDEEDLKAFVNPADWNMPSSENLDPILQFIVYIPSTSNRPLHIKESTGSLSPSNAFMTPQWGGVVIHNPSPRSSSSLQDLSTPFRFFEQQLHQLLGVPLFSSSHGRHTQTTGALAQWQVDGLVRRRLGEATKECVETLAAIVKLVEDIPNMRVGEEVVEDVRRSLRELELAEEKLSTSPESSLYHSATALKLASRAYFNPTMLALLYFPDEHKYAVYCPFFLPIAVPMLSAAFKELKEWRKKRKGLNVL